MTIGDRIREKRKELGYTQEELAKKLGYASRSSVNKIENARELSNKKVQLFADILQTTPAYLMGWVNEELLSNEIKIIEKIDDTSNKDKFDILSIYKKLNKANKNLVYDYMNTLIDKQNSVKKETLEYYPIRTVKKVVAGTGYSYNTCNECEVYYTNRNDLKSYDIATVVTGDSMTPKYNDGDVILIKNGYDNIEGAVYVVDYYEKSYVKKVYNEGHRFRLVSTNDKYDDIYIEVPPEHDTYFNILGRVVDSFTPILV